jgi:hypothetical protein
MNRRCCRLFFLTLLVTFGCNHNQKNAIDVLRTTLIQRATVRGQQIAQEVETSSTKDIQEVLGTLCPNQEIDYPVHGLEQFELTINAAGNTAIIYCWPGEDRITFKLDGRFYSGGNSREFREAVRKLVEAARLRTR